MRSSRASDAREPERIEGESGGLPRPESGGEGDQEAQGREDQQVRRGDHPDEMPIPPQRLEGERVENPLVEEHQGQFEQAGDRPEPEGHRQRGSPGRDTPPQARGREGLSSRGDGGGIVPGSGVKKSPPSGDPPHRVRSTSRRREVRAGLYHQCPSRSMGTRDASPGGLARASPASLASRISRGEEAGRRASAGRTE